MEENFFVGSEPTDNVSIEGKMQTIVVDGRLDAYRALSLREELEETAESMVDADTSPVFVVDLSALSFIDSAGLAALVVGMKRNREKDGDLLLVKPDDAAAFRVFELTKFDSVFVFVKRQERRGV